MKVPCLVTAPLLVLAAASAWAAQDGFEPLIDLAVRGEEVAVAQLTDALLADGPDGAERWYRTLDLRRPGRELLFPEEAPPELGADILAVLETLTAHVPAEIATRLAELDPIAHDAASHVALDVLARSGDAKQLGLATTLAAPHPEAEYRVHRAVGQDLAAAVTAILRRDPAGYSSVERLYGAGHEWLDLHLLRGIGGAREVLGLKLLPRLLASVPTLDASVLLEIGNVAREVDTPLDDSALQRVRLYLTSPQAEERKQAAIALGRLDDYEAVEPLIELLRDTDRGVRTNAYWALREITAMTIDAEPRRWHLWFDDEEGWWAEQAPDLLRDLNDVETAEVCRAINECGRKRLFRRQLTPPLLPLLEHEDETIVRAACSALFTLRATGASTALIRVLEHPEQRVRLHAWSVLKGLTGREDLPLDPQSWRQALGDTRPTAR